MIGLLRGTVQLLTYQTSWKKEFEKTKQEILDLIDKKDVLIEHIGSTAIEGIHSKPIIDIAVAVETKTVLKEVINSLTKHQFEDRGDRSTRGGYLFVKNVGPDIVSHHIHILLQSDIQWKNYLNFRDTLIADPVLAKAYEKLKMALYQKHKTERAEYTKGKEMFIQDVLNS